MRPSDGQVFKAIKRAGRPIDDHELADLFLTSPSVVNVIARRLHHGKRTIRIKGSSGRLVNLVNNRRGIEMAQAVVDARRGSAR